MKIMHPNLLREIEAFLADTGMGESYFGKASAGNSELLTRLRNGGRVWPETSAKVRSFMRLREKLPAPLKSKKSHFSIACQSKVSSKSVGAAE